MRTNLDSELVLERRGPVAEMLPQVRQMIREAGGQRRTLPPSFDAFIPFYTVEDIADTDIFEDHEFSFVLEGAVEKRLATRVFLCVIDTGMGFVINARSSCKLCGVNSRICSHGEELLYQCAQMEQAGRPVEFLGYFEDEDWGAQDPDVVEIESQVEREPTGGASLTRFLALPRHFQQPKQWPEQSQVILQIDNRHVTFDNGETRPVIERLLRAPNGELSPVDISGWVVPEEECYWVDRIVKMGRCREARYHYLSDEADSRALVEFAKAGRLYYDGTPVAYAGTLANVLGWEPDGELVQKLVVKLKPPLVWMAGTRGPVLCANKRSLAEIPFNNAQIEMLMSLPPLADDQAEEVRQKWADHPILGQALMPLKPVERRIEERPLTWRVRLLEASGQEGEGEIEGWEYVAVRYELLDGDRAMDLSTRDGQLQHVEDDLWLRYRVPEPMLAELPRALENLSGFVVRTTTTRREVIAPPGSTLAHVALALTLVPGAEAVELPKGLVAGRIAFRKPGTLDLIARITPTEKAAYPYELEMKATAKDEVVDIACLIESKRANASRLIGDIALTMGSRNARPTLREISPGVFAPIKTESDEVITRQLGTLIDHSVRHGKRFYLTEGALLRLATTAGLPIAGSEPLKRARDTVDRLIQAQGQAQAMSIDGIEGITFSPKQAAGVNWLVALRQANLGGVLADKRGAGKTFMALGAIAQTRALRQEGGFGPAVVAMELKELDHWVVKHLMEHCPGLKWEVFHGNRKAEHDTLMAADVVVTTYGVLQRHVERFLDLNPIYLFADEAKRLKNRRSKTWQAVHMFKDSAIISINGTPLTKNVPDVWSGFDLAAPGFLGSLEAFVGSYRANASDPAYLERLRGAMRPLFIRRDIDNGRGMPSKTLLPQLITMDKTQSAQYADALDRVLEQKATLEQNLPRSQANFKIRLMIDRLRSITASPGRTGHLTSKGEAIVEMVSEFVQDDHQVLVFSHNNTYVDAIANILRSEGISTSVYRGSNPRERNREKALFQDGHSRVLVLSDLGAKGLDLPQASRVIITDPWIDADEEDQKADRARRFVSTKDLEVFHLICSGTLEEAAMTILERNREREQAILEGAPAPAPGLAGKTTADDYEFLLSFRPHGQARGGH